MKKKLGDKKMNPWTEDQLAELLGQIGPLNQEACKQSRKQWNQIAKPLYGLGHFEEIIVKIAGIQEKKDVCIREKAVAVFCSDNGVVAEGITQTDRHVTAVVTENIAKGLASVNRMAAVAHAKVFPVDVGVAEDLSEPGIRTAKIGYGTANLRREPAMTRDQALMAIHTGISLAKEWKEEGIHLLAVGEMGIGNTTTSSALASVLLGLPVETVTGPGAGLSREGWSRKIQVIKEAIAFHHPSPEDPIGLMASLGGFDIGAMTGLILGGGIYRIPVVLDGMIAAVAGLLAQALYARAGDFMLASHLGREPVCQFALKQLGLTPVICGDLALGEGTGGVMLFPLLDMACEVYETDGTFDAIQVSAYVNFKGDQI